MDPRSQPTASNLGDGASLVPQFFSGYLSDPRTDDQEQEYAFLLADLKVIFGSPTTGHGTLVPADGVDKPSTIDGNALDSVAYVYFNTDTKTQWTYNPTHDTWHARVYQEVVVSDALAESFAVTVFPTGFTEDNVRSVQLVQLAGTEELGINRWDLLTADTLTVEFRGRQVAAGNHKLIIHYER